MGCLFLIIADKEKNEFVSFYPHISQGVKLELTILEIKELDSLIEAFIIAEDKNGITYGFLDTLYFANKASYEIGESVEFSLSALAIDIEVVKETSFSFDEQQTLSFLAKIGELPTEDQPIKPLVFDMSNMKAFFQNDNSLPSLTQFQSPIEAINEISIHDIDFYEVAIMPTDTLAEANKTLPLYIRKDLLEQPLQQGNPIRGLLLLQGHLAH